MPRNPADRPATEPRRLSEHWMLDDIADRDAQTRPIADPADLPLGRDGTKYDHARRSGSDYHLDTPEIAMGDRQLLLREVRRLRAEAAQGAAPLDDPWVKAYNRGWMDGRVVGRAEGAAPRAEGLDERRLFDEMWAERDVLDAGTEGFSPNRYRSAARRIVARLSRPSDEVKP